MLIIFREKGIKMKKERQKVVKIIEENVFFHIMRYIIARLSRENGDNYKFEDYFKDSTLNSVSLFFATKRKLRGNFK